MPHKYVCPVESDMEYLRAWMHRYAMLQVYVEQHQRWPSRETNMDLYEWVLKQQSLVVHDDTSDSMERMQMQQLDKMGIDWKNAMRGRAFCPTSEYVRLNVRV